MATGAAPQHVHASVAACKAKARAGWSVWSVRLASDVPEAFAWRTTSTTLGSRRASSRVEKLDSIGLQPCWLELRYRSTSARVLCCLSAGSELWRWGHCFRGRRPPLHTVPRPCRQLHQLPASPPKLLHQTPPGSWSAWAILELSTTGLGTTYAARSFPARPLAALCPCLVLVPLCTLACCRVSAADTAYSLRHEACSTARQAPAASSSWSPGVSQNL